MLTFFLNTVKIFPKYWTNIAKILFNIIQILSKYSPKYCLYIFQIMLTNFLNTIQIFLNIFQVLPKWYPGSVQNNVYKLSKYWTNNSQILSKYYPNIISPLTCLPDLKRKPEATNPTIISVFKYYCLNINQIIFRYFLNFVQNNVLGCLYRF